ncbi:Uncharacterised protein [Enterobacter cancerogenus]|uniref:Uncharacterized protein n=1 Tax=Enterobacter cancerogenus TaxID=69218 RepID=A0A484VUW0_9ENTR|nr:Uncharacterised protein [Enterobacter cancerogenus]
MPAFAPLPWQTSHSSSVGIRISFGDTANGFFQRQIHVVTQICAPRRALATTTTAEDVAEDIAKDIAEISAAAKAARAAESAAAHAALFKGRVTVLIVGCTFLRIGQNFVGFFDLFKFGFSLFITPDYGPGDISWPGRLYAFLISRSSAVLGTPKIS